MAQIDNEKLRIRQVYARRDASGKATLYGWLRQDVIFMAYRTKAVWAQAFELAGIADLSQMEILDVGCGVGGWLRQMQQWGADPGRLHGIDLLEDRISLAKARSSPEIDFKIGNACRLDFPDGTFDLCAASTVFSSILSAEARRGLAREMVRVVRPGKWIAIHDYAISHPCNLDTIGIRKSEIGKLFPECKLVQVFKLVFPPPILRLLPARLIGLAHFLEQICPFLCTHRLYLLRK